MSDRMARLRADYLMRLRRSLEGVSADVVDEAVDEISSHIDDALAARPDGGVDSLLDVIARLGPPEVYARDLGLYLMVDRGFRHWSVRHMIGSARFWALGTVVGAAVVMIFGLMFALALVATAIGAVRALFDVGIQAPLVGPLFQGVPPFGLLAGGPLALLILMFALRWFIGQYVQRARPHTLGGQAADAVWVSETSRTILVLAITGLVVAVAAGLAAGAARIDGTALVVDIAPLTESSPAAAAGWFGLALFFLAPMIGLLATVARARRRA